MVCIGLPFAPYRQRRSHGLALGACPLQVFATKSAQAAARTLPLVLARSLASRNRGANGCPPPKPLRGGGVLPWLLQCCRTQRHSMRRLLRRAPLRTDPRGVVGVPAQRARQLQRGDSGENMTRDSTEPGAQRALSQLRQSNPTVTGAPQSRE